MLFDLCASSSRGGCSSPPEKMSGSTSVVVAPPLIEKIRSNHEEIEGLEQLVMKDLMTEHLSPMKQLFQGYRLRNLAMAIIRKTEQLVSTDFKKQYADEKVEGWGNHDHEDELIPYYGIRAMQELINMGPDEKLEKHPHYEIQQSLMEAKVKKLCNLLDETIRRTKMKEALAFEEMEEENTLKQAMGWDGKPIPYWLCKLGLGQEYKCEICRNCNYAGKRAFERHLEEWPHQVELRRLRVPDSVPDRITSVLEPKAEEVKEMNSNQVPAGVAILPPDIRAKLERIASVVSETGLEKEVIALYEEDERINFWKSSDPYHAFYQHKLTEYRAKNQKATHIKQSDHAAAKLPPAEFMVHPLPLESHKFTYRLPEGITRKELDIIKLTAEFWVRSGGCYFEGFSEREIRDHHLDFMNKATDSRFSIFSGFVRAYSEVLKSCPGRVIETLRKNAADVETVLENCYHRLQWDRFRREHTEKKPREVAVPRRLSNLQQMGPPPQPQPEPTKRQKIDESELVPRVSC